MRVSLIALLAGAALASASHNASACDFFRCALYAVGDDAYPPGDPGLDPGVEAAVRARHGYGLSQAGFYNDPSMALASLSLSPPPPPAGWGEPAPEGGPTVIYGTWGETHGHRRYMHERPVAHPHAY